MEEREYFFFDNVERKKPGQTVCIVCNKSYNNAAIPEFCTECNAYFPRGKAQQNKPQSGSQAFLISDTMASVRVHKRGHNKRIFVRLGNEKKVRTLKTPAIFLLWIVRTSRLAFLREKSQTKNVTKSEKIHNFLDSPLTIWDLLEFAENRKFNALPPLT